MGRNRVINKKETMKYTKKVVKEQNRFRAIETNVSNAIKTAIVEHAFNTKRETGEFPDGVNFTLSPVHEKVGN